jgi:hypothetical protein
MLRREVRQYISLSLGLRRLVGRGQGESPDAERVVNALESLYVSPLRDEERSLVMGLLADVLQDAKPAAPAKPLSPDAWLEAVEAAESPQALLDVLRRPAPTAELERRRRLFQAEAWRRLGVEEAAAVFAARAGEMPVARNADCRPGTLVASTEGQP